jgi:hypothetical protein
MIIIRFTDPVIERRALGFLARRFPLKTWANGETMIPEAALAALAVEGIPFSVEGLATYERIISAAVRDTPPAAV